jgi:hypothetical protein
MSSLFQFLNGCSLLFVFLSESLSYSYRFSISPNCRDINISGILSAVPLPSPNCLIFFSYDLLFLLATFLSILPGFIKVFHFSFQKFKGLYLVSEDLFFLFFGIVIIYRPSRFFSLFSQYDDFLFILREPMCFTTAVIVIPVY